MKEKFDERSPYWQSDIDSNIEYVKETQRYLNDLLLRRDYVTIFKVYDELGLRLDINRLLSIKDPRELCWSNDGNDEINFRIKPNGDDGTIDLDFNINID